MQAYISTTGELIEPLAYDVDVIDGEGNKLQAAGDAVPIEARFTPEFVATLRPYDPETEPNPPEREPPPVPVPTASEVLAQRDTLLALATLRIAPLQYAVDLKDATDDEKASLKAWKQYGVALNRIEQQSDFPTAVEWPKAPE